ncbi:DUF1330 domain-containing protein [Nonomuraea candida]|uniref:DUF1330 domain-containing protein n=1 Tax=Nonomuraea candida TaxID=359159 RepID=UPI0005BC536B|nr:DUF1330 domain-containing protein [Nonomuraea candida]
MTAYMLAHLRRPAEVHPEVLEYLERIQPALEPFSGRFLVHGGAPEVREGQWPGDVVLVEFPSMKHARDFYDSAAYQEIKPLRTAHLEGDLIIVDGVGPDHDSAAMAAAMRSS